ncbi:MAG: hypothetical protein AAFP19_00920 [Bacteroidota bacterium]
MNNNKVLILGSGLSVGQASELDVSNFTLLTINNAWQAVDHWDYLIYPDDFTNLPHSLKAHQSIITSASYGPYIDLYGGERETGNTMIFNASYWAIHHLQAKLIAYLGCDMHYPTQGNNTFYGRGTPDPLRLGAANLRRYFAKLEQVAFIHQCRLYNVSRDTPTRLPFKRVRWQDLGNK